MKLKIFSVIALMSLCSSVISQEIVGWIENASLTQEVITDIKGKEKTKNTIEIIVEAKIDSGAQHSSLHCDCVSTTRENGEKWVHLKIYNNQGKSVELDKKVIRQAKIKRHDGKFQIRDVIQLPICLAGIKKEVEVNLIDRSGLNYQLLIGRSFLKNDFLIDPGKTFLNKKECEVKT